jgi:hypothetical protein
MNTWEWMKDNLDGNINVGTVLERDQKVSAQYYHDRRSGKTKVFMDAVKKELSENSIVFKPNTYPYLLPPNVKHWVVWCNKTDIDKESIKDLRKKSSDFFSTDQIIIFRNSSELKSVHDVEHLHVFVRQNLKAVEH